MHRAMLTVLAQADDAGKGVLSKRQIRVRTGYRDSGPVSSAFADLVRDGWATAVSKGELEITPVGRGVLGHYEQLPLGAELRQALLDGRVGKLTTMERKFLAQLCEVHPQALTKAELRDGAGYADSGPVSSAFAHLVALDYAVEAGRGALKASDELFEEA